MLLLELSAILGFATIAFQDLKERMVHWVLFPIVGALLAVLHVQASSPRLFAIYLIYNVFLVSGLILLLYLYTKFIKKQGFLNHSFGLGDILFFYAFALGFPTMTFLTLFCLSICFSMLAFVVLNRFVPSTTVPLAGLMGVFLGIILLLNLFTEAFTLYTY